MLRNFSDKYSIKPYGLTYNRFAKLAIFFVLFLCVFGHARIAFLFYDLSQEKMCLLEKVLDSIYYDNYEIMFTCFIVNLAIILVLLSLVATFVLLQRPVENSEEIATNKLDAGDGNQPCPDP